MITENVSLLKYTSLVILTLQNAVVGLSMRYARTRSGDMFLSSTGKLFITTWKFAVFKTNKYQHCWSIIHSLFVCTFVITAVFMAEVAKLVTCLVLVWIEEGSFSKLLYALDQTIVKQPKDTFKVCVPSLVYIIQNNLLYVSASNLDAATYQVNEIVFAFYTKLK